MHHGSTCWTAVEPRPHLTQGPRTARARYGHRRDTPSVAGPSAPRLKATVSASSLNGQVHRPPDSPEAYKAVIARPKAAPPTFEF